MKTVDKGSGHFDLFPDTENIKDIAIALIMASYELARPMGLGMMRQYGTEMTIEMARKMLQGEDVSKDYAMNTNKPYEVYMDYVFGRCCKTLIKVDIKENIIQVWFSTRDRNPHKILTRTSELLNIQ